MRASKRTEELFPKRFCMLDSAPMLQTHNEMRGEMWQGRVKIRHFFVFPTGSSTPHGNFATSQAAADRRTALPVPDLRDQRLRDLHARSAGLRQQLERRRPALQ